MRCLAAITLALFSIACSPSPAGRTAGASASAIPPEAVHLRDAAFAAAHVWIPPATAVEHVDLASNPVQDPRFSPDMDLRCRFVLQAVGGTTPKFYCDLPDGERVKVKYGAANAELPAEVAASRLLSALGFPADRMFRVARVLCAGCPRFPFQALRCYQRTGSKAACFPGGIDERETVTLAFAVVERRIEGRVIESFEDQGWAWFELDRIDPAKGGAPRAHVDALRLMARVLAHWDNKAQNQRLICPPSDERPDGSCARPLALVQDLGATFGPLKIDLENWRRDRVWKDAATCTISMEHLPWGGGTFPETQITEEGRRMLAGLLEQLSASQLRGLFEGAAVTSHDQVTAAGRTADAWVSAFLQKVDEITSAGPCPQ